MFNNLKLRWKISIILIIIMFIIMTIVSIVNYIYTTKIVKDEVNAKIHIVNKLYKSTINSIFVELDRKIKELAADDSLLSYVDIVDYRYQELNKVRSNRSDSSEVEKEKEKLNNLITSNLENYVASLSWGYLEKINYIDFSYITLIDGMVISSSTRGHNMDGFAKLKRQYLNPSEYKSVNFNSVKEINGQPYLLFNTSIKDSSNKVIGYLILGLSLNSLKDMIDVTLGEYSNVVALLNNDGLILNNPSRERLGEPIKDEWILGTMKSSDLPVDRLGKKKYYIVDKLENKDIYLTATVLKSEILTPVTRLGRIDIYIFIAGIILTILIIYITMGWHRRGKLLL